MKRPNHPMERRCTSNLAADLGRISYDECLELQHRLVSLRRTDQVGNILLFLEHGPVYTIGRKADPANYPEINVTRTERGGDVTYHGPGQLVVYVVFRVERDGRMDVRRFVSDVSQSFVQALRSSGFDAEEGKEEPGIWINHGGRKKVGSVGMAIDHGVSYHGVSLNLTEETLERFRKIRPCGMDPSVMWYVDVPRTDIIAKLLEELGSRFGKFIMVSRSELEILSNLPVDAPDPLADPKTDVSHN